MKKITIGVIAGISLIMLLIVGYIFVCKDRKCCTCCCDEESCCEEEGCCE